MKLLIMSDNEANELYSSIEAGSIGYYPNVVLDKSDYDLIKNNVDKTNILALITNVTGIGKLFFASLSKIEKVGEKYTLTYITSHVINNEDEITSFNSAFPYAFKDEGSAKLSTSKELIKIVNYFNMDQLDVKRTLACDVKEIIINTDAYRLQSAKTEVYKKDIEDGVHSRLSHTVRVNHIANMIAKRIRKNINLDIDYNLIECISMSLNIGHTPYGNVGETVIGEILRGETELIPNIDRIGFKFFKHNLQSARMLEKVEPVSSKQSGCIDLDIITGVIAHTRFNFTGAYYNNPTLINEYLHKYYVNCENIIGEYATLIGNTLIPRTLEAQIVIAADSIAQKTYDVELAIRGGSVEQTEIITRLKLLSEVTGEYFEYEFNNRNDRYYSSRQISSYMVNYLVDSVCEAFKFDLYNKNDSKIENYIDFSEPGRILLDMIDNYFQSKLLLSRKVRLYDHQSKLVIKEIFINLYNDINLLPDFHKNRIIEEFQKEKIKDISMLLAFISFEDGKRYLDNILYSDVTKIRNRVEQDLIIRKREIIIQVIIDYIVYLSDYEAKSLHKYLVYS